MFQDLPAVEAYLNSLINYESRLPLGGRDWPKLGPTLEAVSRLQLPRALANGIHIAGTKGKGSTAAFVDALLTPDENTLVFTSPHLVSFTERVRLNGHPLADSIWCEGFESIVRQTGRAPVIKLTYFEMTFVFYLWAAQHLRTTVHVVEAGLGGRWDATNILEDTLAVLTLVDYDHTHVLGDTLTQIATDKAGIIKPHAQVVVARQPAEALAVYERALETVAARPEYFGRDYGWQPEPDGEFAYYDSETNIAGLSLGTPGVHQRDNAATAIRVARLVRPLLDDEPIRSRLAACVVPGRQQLFRGEPDILLDVAHNPASFAALARTLRSEHAGKRILAAAGLMKDKDVAACFRHLQGLVTEILVVQIDNPRAHPVDELCGRLAEMGFCAASASEPEDAFRLLHTSGSHELGLVTGSFYVAGDYLKWRMRAGIT